MNHNKQTLAAGIYFVGVPIGSARDITLRALDVLASADVLAAEDTRSLRKLMDIHGVPLEGRQIIALHDHSKGNAVEALLDKAAAGKSVSYASEAGMPLVADPGFELSRGAVARDISVTCAPGPSAVLTALVLGGLPTDSFHFAGFLPAKSAARKAALEKLTQVQATLVFYESPKRVHAMLQDAAQVLGADRQGAVCRELTKKFEQTLRGTLEELVQIVGEKSPKGEMVVLIDRSGSTKVSESDIAEELNAALATMSIRDAVDMISKAHDLPRRRVYQRALALTKE